MLEHSRWMTPAQTQFLRRCALFITFLLSGGNNIFPRFPLAILLIGFCFLIKGAGFGFRREMAGNILLMIVTLIVAIIGSDQLMTDAIVIRFSNFSLGMLVLALYLDLPRNQLVDDLYPMLKLMCWQAIITVILGSLVVSLFTIVQVEETLYSTIGWIFTFHSTQDSFSTIVRPDGFFYEPGVLQLYLNLFMFIASFARHSPKDMALSLIAVLCTQSTTGLVVVGGIAILYFLRNIKTRSSLAKIILILFAPLILFPLYYVTSGNIDNKLNGEARGSSWAREYDLRTGLAVAAQHPVLGIGFDYERYYQEALKFGYKGTQLDYRTTINRGNSNGIVTVLYSVGFPLALIFFLGLFRQVLLPHRWLGALIMFVSVMSEALFFTPFILMFAYSGLLLRPRAMPISQWRQGRAAGN